MQTITLGELKTFLNTLDLPPNTPVYMHSAVADTPVEAFEEALKDLELEGNLTTADIVDILQVAEDELVEPLSRPSAVVKAFRKSYCGRLVVWMEGAGT